MNCKHCRGTLFENYEDIAIGSLFKSKNETKEKVLNKSKSLVKIFFAVIFLGVLSYEVRSSVMFAKNLSKSFDF